MSDAKGRRRRRKLAAHDRGLDRHNKGVEVLKKWARAELERNRQNAMPGLRNDDKEQQR